MEPDFNVDKAIRRLTENALVYHNFNRTHSARALGISIRCLRMWIEKYGIPANRKEVTAAEEFVKLVDIEDMTVEAACSKLGISIGYGYVLYRKFFCVKKKRPLVEANISIDK